jgi:hypothetical protein
MNETSNLEHINSILQIGGCSYKDITRVSSATEKNKADIKGRVAKWDHRTYMPYVQCTVVNSVRIFGRICTVHKSENKMVTSLKTISDKLLLQNLMLARSPAPVAECALV